MRIALTKLADVALRSLFVLVVLYGLPVRSTGAFGLALTLMGFFTFAVGYERYLDLQRRMVSQSALAVDKLIITTLLFYLRNYVVALPVFMGLLYFWVSLPVKQVLMFAVVSVVEHLSNEAYRITLIAPQYYRVLIAAVVKNGLLLFCLGLLIGSGKAEIASVMAVWLACSMAGFFAMAFAFGLNWQFKTWRDVSGCGLAPATQYSASATHFLIGLVALAALQVDRLVSGLVLTLDQAGLYFRHVYVASFAYQLFNVASYNRLVPLVYRTLQAGQPELARRAIIREIWQLCMLFVLGLAVLAVVRWYGLPKIPALQGLSPLLMGILFLGFFLRAMADLQAMQFHAVHLELDVFRAQAAALAVAVFANLSLGKLFGLEGAVISLIPGAGAYLIFLLWFRKQRQTRFVQNISRSSV